MVSKWINNNIQLSPEGEVNSGGYIHGDAKRRGIYLALFTDPGGGGGEGVGGLGNSFFSIYQISWIKIKKK